MQVRIGNFRTKSPKIINISVQSTLRYPQPMRKRDRVASAFYTY
jgi:hypothetical protein